MKQSSHENSPDRSDTKFKGVRKRKWGKWVSEIRLPNSRERIWLGSYESAEKAARAFDAAQFCLRGSNGSFNFPHNVPDIAGGRQMSPPEIQLAAARFANSEPINHRPDIQIESPSHFVDNNNDNDVAMYDLADPFMSLGSGNYSEFGLFPGLYDSNGDFLVPPPMQTIDYGEENADDYLCLDSSTSLWNF